jgi:hypothetical protein
VSKKEDIQHTDVEGDPLRLTVNLVDGYRVQLGVAISVQKQLKRLQQSDLEGLESLYSLADRGAAVTDLSAADRRAIGLEAFRRPEDANRWEDAKHVLTCSLHSKEKGSLTDLNFVDPFATDDVTQNAIRAAFKLTLGNGYRIDANAAVGYLNYLQALAIDEEELAKLHAVAHGQAKIADLSGLAEELFCYDDGTGPAMGDDARNLILCALKETHDGFVLKDPFGNDALTRRLLGDDRLQKSSRIR